VENHFIENIDRLERSLPKDKKERERIIQDELQNINSIIGKLDLFASNALRKSLKEYTDHVSLAHNNVMESFVIPFSIKGLTDNK
jgi:hypothetical protein